MNSYAVLSLLFVTAGSFFYGYDSGCTTSIFGYPSFLEYFDLDANKIGGFGSAYYGGSVIGSVVNFWLPDKYGRIFTVQASCVICILGVGMQTGAQHFATLLVGRIIGGIACGMIFSVCPSFASEISSPNIRGRIAAIYSINCQIAYALTEWMGLGFSYLSGDASWRVLLGLQLVPALSMLAGSFWIPESPRWLIYKGRNEEALKVLSRMHKSVNGDEEFYLKEFHQIRAQLELEGKESLGVAAIFKDRRLWRRASMPIIFYALVMGTGVIPLQNYQVFVYASLGVGNKMALVLTGVWGTTACLSNSVGLYFMDKIRRRTAFFTSMTIVTTGSLLLVAFWATYQRSNSTNKVFGRLSIFSMFVFEVGFTLFLNTFGFLYFPEILPLKIRATGVAAGLGAFNCVTIMLVQVTPLALDAINWKYFMIFVIMDAVFITYFYFFFPETSGKTLEEIAGIFGDEVAETIEDAGQHLDEIKDFVPNAPQVKNSDSKHVEDVVHVA